MQRREHFLGARAATGMLKTNLHYLLKRERFSLIDEFDKLLVGLVVARRATCPGRQGRPGGSAKTSGGGGGGGEEEEDFIRIHRIL